MNNYNINNNKYMNNYNINNNMNKNINRNINVNRNININNNININKNINPNINSNDIFGLINDVQNYAMGKINISELNKYNNNNININYGNNNKNFEDQKYDYEPELNEEERKKREEDERKKKEEEQKRKKEWMKKSPEEVRKLEEERYKREEENILSGIKDRINAQKKYKEDREKQEQIEKEKQDKDEKRWKSHQKLGVQYHTQKEIKQFSKNILELLNWPVEYDISPVTRVPYNSGKIAKTTNDNALKLLNCLRYAAGLSHNITMTQEYNNIAQNACLLMKLNNKLAHVGQPRPNGLDKKIYDSGAKGCVSSNLGSGYSNLMKSVLAWASDQDQFNFPRVGHRRWVFNPTMKNTGFGYIDKFTAMFTHDSIEEESDVKNVAWPSQNMPIEFFGDNYPWSLSTDQDLEKKVKVSITNKKTNKVTTFDRITPDKFSVDNDDFGQIGCVIFRPNFKYQDGDSFRVDVNCTDFSVSYDVNFFNLKCPHKKEFLGKIESSCIKQGKLIYFCDKCGIIEEYTPYKPHDEESISLTKANSKIKGRKKFKCCYCCQMIDEEN